MQLEEMPTQSGNSRGKCFSDQLFIRLDEDCHALPATWPCLPTDQIMWLHSDMKPDVFSAPNVALTFFDHAMQFFAPRDSARHFLATRVVQHWSHHHNDNLAGLVASCGVAGAAPAKPTARLMGSTGSNVTTLDSATEASISERFRELRGIAHEEGITWVSAAEQQFWSFVQILRTPSRPALAVDDNGDIRALWHNLFREQVGLRFRGAPDIDAVLFGRTEHGMRRETVRAEPEAIVRLIYEMKLIDVTRG